MTAADIARRLARRRSDVVWRWVAMGRLVGGGGRGFYQQKRIVENDVAGSQLKSVKGVVALTVGGAEEVAAGSAAADCLGQNITVLEPRHVEVTQRVLVKGGSARGVLAWLP